MSRFASCLMLFHQVDVQLQCSATFTVHSSFTSSFSSALVLQARLPGVSLATRCVVRLVVAYSRLSQIATYSASSFLSSLMSGHRKYLAGSGEGFSTVTANWLYMYLSALRRAAAE